MKLDIVHIQAYLARRLGQAVKVPELQALDTHPSAVSGNHAGLLLSYDTFNELPQYVRALDICVHRSAIPATGPIPSRTSRLLWS